MSALLEAAVSWRALLLAVFVFGFAPKAALRVIVLAFERDDPRRAELLAEVYAVPRWERPFWVAQQLETALFEGIWERVLWALTGRILYTWKIDSGVDRNRKCPDTFPIPTEAEKSAIQPGDLVKVIFDMRWPDDWAERMWVKVERVGRRRIKGTLCNTPIGIPRLDSGDKIVFRRKHIIDIDRASGDDSVEVRAVA